MKDKSLETTYLRSMSNKQKLFDKKNRQDRIKILDNRYDFHIFADDISAEKEELIEIGQDKILEITSFFRCQDDPEYFPSTVLEFFPSYLQNNITPYVLLGFPVLQTLKDIGYCVYCKHYKGFTNIHPKSLRNNNKKVLPYMGICCNDQKRVKSRSKINGIEISNHVSSFFRCPSWHPAKLYHNIFQSRIMEFIKNNPSYTKKRYEKELEDISITHYFFED